MKITNNEQFQKLVEELEKNPSLAKGFKKGTVPTNFKQQWENIASILNASGPPSRDGDGWQKVTNIHISVFFCRLIKSNIFVKVWRDLKFKVKRKIVKNKSEMRATGGGINKYVILSPLEEAVANLLQFEKQINPEGSAYGVAASYEELVTEVLGVDPAIEMQTNVDFDHILVEQEDASTSRNGSSLRVTPSGSMPTNTVPLRAATPINRKKNK